MEWDDVRYFLAVARGGGLSPAARALGVNHSTVFRRVNALETRLGARLFDRLPDGYALTPAGEAMMADAVAVDEHITALDRRMSGQDHRLTGSLRVTTTDTIAHEILMPHLARFRTAHPSIDLELVIGNPVVNLSKREADVAIRPSLEPGSALVGRRISGLAMAVYGAEGYMTQRGRPRRATDLASHDWVAGDESLAHLPWSRWLAKRVKPARIVYRSNSLLDQICAADAGFGLAVLPCALANSRSGLVRLFPPDPAFASELWLVTHADLRHGARVRAFLDFMAPSLMRERARLEGRIQRTSAGAVELARHGEIH
jgi:DNA-binding transcriptional LysR family regulator